jgi:hypothetical protein
VALLPSSTARARALRSGTARQRPRNAAKSPSAARGERRHGAVAER